MQQQTASLTPFKSEECSYWYRASCFSCYNSIVIIIDVTVFQVALKLEALVATRVSSGHSWILLTKLYLTG